MNLLEIRTATRLIISETDPNNSHFTDTDLNTWINEWYRDASIKVRSPIKEATILTVAGQPTYELPTKFLSLTMLFLEQESGLQSEIYFTNIKSMSNVFGREWLDSPAGKPATYYFSDRNILGLHPKPDTANGNRNMRMFYIPIPDDLVADTDEPDLEDIFHDSAKYFVGANANDSLQNFSAGKLLAGKYERKLQEFKDQGRAGSEDQGDWQWDGMSNGSLDDQRLRHPGS